MARSWTQRHNAVSDMEEQNILGRGHKSSADQLEDIGYRSVYERAFIAAAKRIRELEALVVELESDNRDLTIDVEDYMNQTMQAMGLN